MGNTQKPSAVDVNKDSMIPPAQSIYEQSETAKGSLGTKITVGDKVFRYAKNGAAALAAGKVACAPSLVAADQILAVAVVSAGGKTITVTGGASTAITANAYQDGEAVVNAGANAGLTFRVKKNSAVATTATGTITLYDSLPVALNATDKVQLVLNKYAGVVVGSQALDTPVGVAPIAVTTGNYFWLQTAGIAAPSHQAHTPPSVAVCMGTTGGVTQAFFAATTGAATTTLVIGKNLALTGTAGQNSAVLLTMEDA